MGIGRRSALDGKDRRRERDHRYAALARVQDDRRADGRRDSTRKVLQRAHERGCSLALDENPPVGLILCAQRDEALARYALGNLPNKVLAAEYRTVLPDEKLIAADLQKARRILERRGIRRGRK